MFTLENVSSSKLLTQQLGLIQLSEQNATLTRLLFGISAPARENMPTC